MALDVDTLAVIAALNSHVGETVSYRFLADEYRHHGGERKALGETLTRVLRQWPECAAHENRLAADRRIETWVRVVAEIKLKKIV